MTTYRLAITLFFCILFNANAQESNMPIYNLQELIEVGNTLYKENPDSAHRIASQVKRLARSTKDYNALAEAYHLDGKTYRRVDRKGDSALVCHYNAINYFNRTDNNKGKAKTYFALGMCNFNSYSYEIAVEHFLTELTYRVEIGDKSRIAKCYFNIGLAHTLNFNYDSALVYLKQAASINTEINKPQVLAECYLTIGNCYHNKEEFATALDYYDRSYKLASEIADNYTLARVNMNRGSVYLEEGNFESAIEHYEKSLTYTELQENKSSLIHVYHDLGELYFKTQDYKKSLTYLELAVKIGPSEYDAAILSECYELLVNLHIEMKNFESLAIVSKTSSAYNKSMAKKYERNRIQYEKFQTERIEINYAHQTLEAQNNTNLAYLKGAIAAIASLGMILLIVGFILRRSHQMKKAQGVIIRDLKEKDRFLQVIKNELKVDIAGIARILEHRNPSNSYKSIT
ncbi:MAG: tetratricopeptide repeat protein [Cyclobacteriaceae bacterium]